MKIDNGYASHQLVLTHVIENLTNKPILELGSGDYSTKLIHGLVKDRTTRYLTIDFNLDWLNRYMDLKSDTHDLIYYDSNRVGEFYAADNEDWGLVFIDIGTWQARADAMHKYKNAADYVMLHDCDYFPNNGFFGTTARDINQANSDMGVRSYDDIFKYWIEFFMEDWATINPYPMPPTLLGSNRFPLDDVNIEGMIICGRNK